jgi:hypothetical protein
MMVEPGPLELLVVLVVLISIGLPVAVLVLLLKIFRKLRGIEEKLSKP